jgi:SOS-response transcriptional repressor LexA
MNYTLQHRDIAGAPLAEGDHCIVTEHNRIILARVLKLYENSNQVQLKPLNSSAGNRRSKPNQRPIRRECYNVYRLADTEITMSILKGSV